MWFTVPQIVRIGCVVFGSAGLFFVLLDALAWVYRKFGLLP